MLSMMSSQIGMLTSSVDCLIGMLCNTPAYHAPSTEEGLSPEVECVTISASSLSPGNHEAKPPAPTCEESENKFQAVSPRRSVSGTGSANGFANLKGSWEPYHPWLFLDRVELGRISTSCRSDFLNVEEFTPFGDYTSMVYGLVKQNACTTTDDKFGDTVPALQLRDLNNIENVDDDNELEELLPTDAEVEDPSYSDMEDLGADELEELRQTALMENPQNLELRFQQLLAQRQQERLTW